MTEHRLMKHVDVLIRRYPILEPCRESIIYAYTLMQESYSNNVILAAITARALGREESA